MAAKCELKLIMHTAKLAFRFNEPGIKTYWLIGAVMAVLGTLLIGVDNLPIVMFFGVLLLYIVVHDACKQEE